jgi:hypothetical protein
VAFRKLVGSGGGTTYASGKDGKPFLTKEPKYIHLMVGAVRPRHSATRMATGRMLEYNKAGDGARLSMLVLHDDAKREYAYGPAQGLPDSRISTFPQTLYDEANRPTDYESVRNSAPSG